MQVSGVMSLKSALPFPGVKIAVDAGELLEVNYESTN